MDQHDNNIDDLLIEYICNGNMEDAELALALRLRDNEMPLRLSDFTNGDETEGVNDTLPIWTVPTSKSTGN